MSNKISIMVNLHTSNSIQLGLYWFIIYFIISVLNCKQILQLLCKNVFLYFNNSRLKNVKIMLKVFFKTKVLWRILTILATFELIGQNSKHLNSTFFYKRLGVGFNKNIQIKHRLRLLWIKVFIYDYAFCLGADFFSYCCICILKNNQCGNYV